MGRRLARWLYLAAVLVSIASCTPDKPSISTATPVPARQPVADKPPYVCYFIPQMAVAELTGYTGQYTAGPSKRSDVGDSCAVTNDVQSILVTGYDRSADQKVLDNYIKGKEKEERVKLPAELGMGEIGNDEIRGYPFRAAAVWFRCGNKSPLIRIYIKKNTSRDQDHDLIQLMQIAQRRFAEMFKCKPDGPPPGK
ncbi:hypothetical protein AB0J35_20300 [Nonomuraea angiospora]|uniref:hypothetical protein n=1 Tax=Nonomuraea angiospora TaxID=46172 RepID=UPI003444BB7E